MPDSVKELGRVAGIYGNTRFGIAFLLVEQLRLPVLSGRIWPCMQ